MTNNEREKLILLATMRCYEETPDCSAIKCYRVLIQAITMAGEWDERMQAHRSEICHGYFEIEPRAWIWYETMIKMTLHEPEAERLLNGRGRLILDDYSGPYFTECALTELGRQVGSETQLRQ